LPDSFHQSDTTGFDSASDENARIPASIRGRFVRKSTIVMIAFAVMFGLLAVFVAQTWLNSAAEQRMRSLEANNKKPDQGEGQVSSSHGNPLFPFVLTALRRFTEI